MGFGIRLHVWGERACFTRPEMKVERVSYDVMTPSAARGILDAIHWKPALRWHVDRIHVLRPIRFESVRRNEVGSKVAPGAVSKAMKAGTVGGLCNVVDEDRQQRAATILRDVAYVIEAHFSLTPEAGRTRVSVVTTTADAVPRGCAFTVRVSDGAGQAEELRFDSGVAGGAFADELVEFVAVDYVLDPHRECLVYDGGQGKPDPELARERPFRPM